MINKMYNYLCSLRQLSKKIVKHGLNMCPDDSVTIQVEKVRKLGERAGRWHEQ